MKIGIDCRTIYDVEKNKGAGIERFVFYLVRKLVDLDHDNQYVLFFDPQISYETMSALKRKHVTIKKVSTKLPFISPHISFARQLKAADLDVCLFPANTMPLFYTGPSILTVHDLAIYVHPEWFPEQQWLATKFVVPRSIRQATSVVCISEQTKQEVKELFDRTDNVHVIRQGIPNTRKYDPSSATEVLSRFDITKPFIFFLGTIEPRKNLVKTIRAFEKFCRLCPDYELIIAGREGWKSERSFKQVDRTNQGLKRMRVKYLRTISDADKAVLLHECQAFLFTTSYEGFGVPVYEAMSYGAPVITSKIAVFQELIKDQAVLVDPSSVMAIKDGLKKVLHNEELRQALSVKGQALASTLTWSNTANQYLQLLKDQRSKQ